MTCCITGPPSRRPPDHHGSPLFCNNRVESLKGRGYYYESAFQAGDDGSINKLVTLARELGTLYVAPGMSPELPVLKTDPSSGAPPWNPFDRPERIGWHNDFSTIPDRPVVSLAWIARGDPESGQGDWRVASCERVVERLARDPDLARELDRLRREPLPYGYSDSQRPSLLPLLYPVPGEPEREGMRFYGRALREGALLHSGVVPAATVRMISAIEKAADEVGETLPATTGALLVCHNDLALHDRTAQTVTGSRPRRTSVLCFLKSLHRRV